METRHDEQRDRRQQPQRGNPNRREQGPTQPRRDAAPTSGGKPALKRNRSGVNLGRSQQQAPATHLDDPSWLESGWDGVQPEAESSKRDSQPAVLSRESLRSSSEIPPRRATPVFLPTQVQEPFDPETLIDLTPWEADIDGDLPVEGTLYSMVSVRHTPGRLVREYEGGDHVFRKGDRVVVVGEGPGETGTVVAANVRKMVQGRPRQVAPAGGESAPPQDARREQEVLGIARHMVAKSNMPVKVVKAQADGPKVVVYLSSEERLDFRELFRRIAAAAQGRVEIRMVGARDCAKITGGVAPCGLSLCCHSFLKDFAPVSIKMAKDQGLVLNPQRVSGVCGRLLCCLTYEDELYRTQRKLLPKAGKRVLTPDGPGRVREVDVLSQSVRVSLDTGETVTFAAKDVVAVAPPTPAQDDSDRRRSPRRGRGSVPPPSDSNDSDQPVDESGSDLARD